MNILKLFCTSSLLMFLYACSDSTTQSDAQATSSKWIEGQHYTLIENTTISEDKNVKEYFSFWCPHCYQSEPFMQALAASLPTDITFTKVHVNFMGFLPKATQDLGTQALLAARANGTENAFIPTLFDAIHVERKNLDSLMNFSPIFKQTATGEASLSALMKDKQVKSLVNKNNQNVEQIRPYIKGVPSLVVNDRYLLDLTLGMDLTETKQLIIWLSEKEEN